MDQGFTKYQMRRVRSPLARSSFIRVKLSWQVGCMGTKWAYGIWKEEVCGIRNFSLGFHRRILYFFGLARKLQSSSDSETRTLFKFSFLEARTNHAFQAVAGHAFPHPQCLHKPLHIQRLRYCWSFDRSFARGDCTGLLLSKKWEWYSEIYRWSFIFSVIHYVRRSWSDLVYNAGAFSFLTNIWWPSHLSITNACWRFEVGIIHVIHKDRSDSFAGVAPRNKSLR